MIPVSSSTYNHHMSWGRETFYTVVVVFSSFCYLMMPASPRFPQCCFAALCILALLFFCFFLQLNNTASLWGIYRSELSSSLVFNIMMLIWLKKTTTTSIICQWVFPGGEWTWHGVITRAVQLFRLVNAEREWEWCEVRGFEMLTEEFLDGGKIPALLFKSSFTF